MRYLVLATILFVIGACSSQEKTQGRVMQKPVESKDSTETIKKDVEIEAPVVNLSPLESIKDLDKKVESYKTGDSLSEADLEYNRQLKQKIIRGTFDLSELCRLALDIHWQELSLKDHTYFIDLMTRLLETKAIFSKEQVKGDEKPYRVTYKKEEYLDNERTRALVSSSLYVPSEKISLRINYKLKKTPMGWNIFDVIVDEASLVENYKFQFDTIITKYGYKDLIDRMEKKLAEMK